MSSPSATAIFVGGASLLHLLPKFNVTITFAILETEFGPGTLLYFITDSISAEHCFYKIVRESVREFIVKRNTMNFSRSSM